LVSFLTNLGKKRSSGFGIDPSSTVSHGSILGDKTRMEELVKMKAHTFVRVLLARLS
jgi:LAO/AO transport system kinase